MSTHSYNKVWIHLIWGTKGHQKTLSKSVRPIVAERLFKIADDKNFFLRSCHVNNNHVHTLIDLPTNLTIEEVAQALKGVSSRWINKEKILKRDFHWGRGYGVFSVSESVVNKVVDYINNQEEHHRYKTFRDEVLEFLEAYNIEFSDDWMFD